MFDTKILGQRVFELRRKEKINQKQLGDAIGLTHKAISTIESGTRGTTIDKVVALAHYFHVPADYLLGITDGPAWRGE